MSHFLVHSVESLIQKRRFPEKTAMGAQLDRYKLFSMALQCKKILEPN